MIISLGGPSGVGKGYIKERLLSLYPHIEEMAWLTTRPLRPKELIGTGNRISIPLSEFNRLNGLGELVLVQNLFGHFYGLRKVDLLPSSAIKITEVHPDNMVEACKVNAEIIAIGLVTSDLSFLRKRLTLVRKTESEAEIEERVIKAKSEIETILQQKHLYASVIEITEAEEDQVFEKVHAILQSEIETKGERR